MNQKTSDSDSDQEDESDEFVDLNKISHHRAHEKVASHAFDHLFESHDSLLFGTQVRDIDTKALHPPSGQILKLWQVYVDNVNPLLKVTHTSSLQARMIDAAVNIASVPTGMEALMFSIYCVAIFSLDEAECEFSFGSPKDTLLKGYQFACKQALIKAALLRSQNREHMTALFLYLVSYRPGTDPRALAPMLGIAVRLAQRLGLDQESELVKCTALEAEMRRRLWWSLVMFDNRLCEMSHHGSTSLLPTWQCRPVLNVNDADLLPDSMLAPEAYKRPTEAIFVVVRSEICDFVRQSTFHLSFTNPTLMPLAQDAHQSEGERRTRLLEFEERIESQYLSKCNPERALDCMTIWSTRTLLARLHVLQYYAASAQSSAQATESQRDGAVWYAVKMIECDTQLAQAPHVNGFRWHVHMHFPAPAYIHIVQDLRKRPVQKHARRCWDVMSENYVARLKEMHVGMSPFLRILSNSLSRAWEGYVAALPQGEEFPAVPPIIEHVKRSMGARDRTTRSMKSGMESMTAVGITDNWIPNNANLDMPPLRTATPPHNIMGFETLPGVAGSDDTDLDLSQFDLSTMDWSPLLALGGSHIQ